MSAPFGYGSSISAFIIFLSDISADDIRNFSCTFCKTSIPSLLFSRSPSTPFPADHHIQPTPPNRIAAALANTDKLEKGERWDKGLTMPGTLELALFPFSDEKLGVVFEDEDMVSHSTLLRSA